MKEFMAYVQNAFYTATGWNQDNSYSTLNSTVDGTNEAIPFQFRLKRHRIFLIRGI